MNRRQGSLLGGEIDPNLWNQFELPHYVFGARTIENYLVLENGMCTRRPGWLYAATTKGNATGVLVPFTYSVNLHYVLEFTALVMRIYKNHVLIASEGNAVEIETPFTANELLTLQYYQEENTLWITTAARAIYTLTRNSDISWKFTPADITDTPFGTINESSTTIEPSATTDDITLTASAELFKESHVDQYWRILHDLALQGDGAELTSAHQFPQTGNPLLVAPETEYRLSVVPTTGWPFRVWLGTIKLEISTDGSEWMEIWSYTQDNPAVVVVGLPLQRHYNDTGENFLIRWKVTDLQGPIPQWPALITIALNVDPCRWGGVVQITDYKNRTEVDAIVISRLGSTNPTRLWQISAWGGDFGWPLAIGFQAQRLIIGGTNAEPTRLDFSRAPDSKGVQHYTDFTRGVNDDDAFGVILSQQTKDPIRWVSGDFNWELIVATAGKILELRPLVESDGFKPTNFPKIYRSIAHPMAWRMPAAMEDVILGIGGVENNRLYEMSYSWQQGGIVAQDLTFWARHIGGPTGFQQLCVQRDPQPILWAVRRDGQMAGMTYVARHAAWHRTVTNGTIIWACRIPTSGGDEIWAVIQRTINNTIVYCVEYMATISPNTPNADSFLLDCGAKWDGGDVVDIADVTRANPGVVTVASWPVDADGNDLADDDRIRIASVAGMTQLNGKVYIVADADKQALTFTLKNVTTGAAVDTRAYGAYSGGTGTVTWVRKTFTAAHLALQAITYKADGKAGSATADGSGVVTLSDYAHTIHVGLGYTSTFRSLPLEAYGGGTSIGRTKRFEGLVVHLHNTTGGKYRVDDGSFYDIPRPPLLPAGQPINSTVILEGLGGWENRDLTFDIVQSDPYPITICGFVARTGP